MSLDPSRSALAEFRSPDKSERSLHSCGANAAPLLRRLAFQNGVCFEDLRSDPMIGPSQDTVMRVGDQMRTQIDRRKDKPCDQTIESRELLVLKAPRRRSSFGGRRCLAVVGVFPGCTVEPAIAWTCITPIINAT